MVDVFENLFKYGPVLLVMSLPTLFSMWIAYRCSSWRRALAVLLVVFTGLVFSLETYTLMQKGNLFALVTMLSLPLVLIFIILLIIAERIAKRA